MSAIAALASVAVLATSAAADEAPPSPGPCTFTVTPNPVTTFPADVVVAGSVPIAGVTVKAYVNGVEQPGAVVVDASLQFSIPVHLTAAADITVNYFYGDENAYATGCADPGGSLVVRVKAAEASRALAFTGSNNTHSFVLIGIAALVVGLVLTMGARRRNKITA
ncbi:MAG: LPXTG cell wall anchor domain-containing protein [Acidimicrobiia bacterium]